MEQAQRFHGELMGKRVRGLDWDLNDWKWDGDLFIATPSHRNSNSNSSNTSSSCSDDVDVDVHDGRSDLERKRRVVVLHDDTDTDSEPQPLPPPPPAASLALKLGATPTPNPKKTKLGGSGAICQVQDCGADLSKAKDYHRRHKVCELHSKATQALVSNLMQRFCQQCSRFHVLDEFDEGKRSCRRRLAGHNKRRRKTHPDSTLPLNSLNHDHTNNVLLLSLLRFLSNLHANTKSDQTTDQELIAQLLGSLANPSALSSGKTISSILHDSQNLLNGGMPNKHDSTFLSTHLQNPSRLIHQRASLPDSDVPRKGVGAGDSRGVEMQAPSQQKPGIMSSCSKEIPPAYSESSAGRMKLNNFDLNDTYVDSDDGMEALERSPPNDNFTSTLDFHSWARQVSLQSSPPQTSGNSDSASAQSPSSSSGEAQSRTGRIVFKLFGKEPSDFPIVLRGQILDWLSHSPTEMESYIRPGCIILTIYLRLADSLWEELCSDLSSCLTRLFEMSDYTFWRTGWVCARVLNQIAFVYNGQIVLDTSLPFQNSICGRISSVVPIAAPISEEAHFEIKGSNLSRSTTSVLCALEGKYLNQEAVLELEDGDSIEERDQTEHASLCCSMPGVVGRGFIEVEDYDLCSNFFFPFIVAEKDVCCEIRMLEDVLDLEADEDAYELSGKSEARRQAMDFINEMGWLLHRSQLKSRLGHLDPNTVVFSFKRFKWLMDFSMDHDWCAVVKKLLDMLVAGIVGPGEHPSLKVVLSHMGLLHRAVRRNCRSMVEVLLRYAPLSVSEGFVSTPDENQEKYLFTPDALGPSGLTPLHVAAGLDGAEDMVDALTDDPGKIGIEAWKNACDSTSATPEDYARLRGHYAYIHLVQKKINGRSVSGHVVLDIPSSHSATGLPAKQDVDGAASFEIGNRSTPLMKSCRLCDKKVAYYGPVRAAHVYRPAMLSMVAIAAVCVCMALMFRGMPNVVCLFRPFRWEMLEYGSS